MQDRQAPTVSQPAPVATEATTEEPQSAAPGMLALATAASAGPTASEQAYGATDHDLPSAHFDQPIGGHGGHHHLQMIAIHGHAHLRDAHGHPLVDAAGKPIRVHGHAAVQAMNAPLGHGATALYYVWGHASSPHAPASGYLHGEDLAHPPHRTRQIANDVRHVGMAAPLSDEHFVASPQVLPEDFAFKKNPSHGTFADYGAGGRTHSQHAEVGTHARRVMYMTWNVPDHHAGRGGGITHGMLTEGDKITRCRVAPRHMKSADAPGTAVWWYVHAQLHGVSVYGWVLAEAEVGGQKLQQLSPS